MFNKGKNRLSELLAEKKTRAQVHTVLLMIGASILLAGELNFQLFVNIPEAPDKALHFIIGRWVAAGIFFFAYICIVWRVLLSDEGSLTRVLIWVPTMIAAALILAIVFALAIAFLKEALDIGTGGDVEWKDITVTLDGALSMFPLVSIIMAATPIFIPLDILLQIPKMVRADSKIGIASLDRYVKARKSQMNSMQPAQALLVEDDIHCATTVLNFCSNNGIHCHHVSTISEAEKYLYKNIGAIRLVLFDNFVRVDPNANKRTGSDWLKEFHSKIPASKRKFLTVMISGHTEELGEVASLTDLVLEKPLEPDVLQQFLLEKGILK